MKSYASARNLGPLSKLDEQLAAEKKEYSIKDIRGQYYSNILKGGSSREALGTLLDSTSKLLSTTSKVSSCYTKSKLSFLDRLKFQLALPTLMKRSAVSRSELRTASNSQNSKTVFSSTTQHIPYSTTSKPSPLKSRTIQTSIKTYRDTSKSPLCHKKPIRLILHKKKWYDKKLNAMVSNYYRNNFARSRVLYKGLNKILAVTHTSIVKLHKRPPNFMIESAKIINHSLLSLH